MEKIKLYNGQELNLVPMGISIDAYNKTNRFDIIADLPYTELEDILLTEDSIKVIQHLSVNDEVLATYTDCVVLKSITKERDKYIDEDLVAHDIFTIVLNTDATATKIRTLEQENALLKHELDQLKEQNITLTETVDFLVLSALEKNESKEGSEVVENV